MGLYGLRSHEKFVPERIFKLPNDQVVLFLRHLWATDGSVRWNDSSGAAQIYYASTSRRLVDDVMQLLLRHGVCSRIARVRKSGYRDCWHLYIDRAENQTKFLRSVGVHGSRGESAREVLTELGPRTGRPGADTVPKEVWNKIGEALAAKRITHRELSAAMDSHFADATRRFAPGRSRLHGVAAMLEDREIHTLATSDVFWDKIVEISSIGECDVYDGTVSEHTQFRRQFS